MQSVDGVFCVPAVDFELVASPRLSPLVQVNSESYSLLLCSWWRPLVVAVCRRWHVVAVVCM